MTKCKNICRVRKLSVGGAPACRSHVEVPQICLCLPEIDKYNTQSIIPLFNYWCYPCLEFELRPKTWTSKTKPKSTGLVTWIFLTENGKSK